MYCLLQCFCVFVFALNKSSTTNINLKHVDFCNVTLLLPIVLCVLIAVHHLEFTLCQMHLCFLEYRTFLKNHAKDLYPHPYKPRTDHMLFIRLCSVRQGLQRSDQKEESQAKMGINTRGQQFTRNLISLSYMAIL